MYTRTPLIPLHFPQIQKQHNVIMITDRNVRIDPG